MKNRIKFLRWARWFYLVMAAWSVLTVLLRVLSWKFSNWVYVEIFNLINVYHFFWISKEYDSHKRVQKIIAEAKSAEVVN